MYRERFTRSRRLWTQPVLLFLLVAAPFWNGCAGTEADAYGNFEATEVTVAAEVAGRLVWFQSDEGVRLEAGRTVGLVDTTSKALQRRELVSRRQTARARVTQAERQIDVLAVQLETAQEELERDERLLDDNAATPRQVNLQRGEVRRLEQQLQAARAQVASARSEIASIDAQIEQIDQQIDDSYIENTVDGIVLAAYVEPGEYVQPGRALYEIASLDTLKLRAYVSGAQLSSVRLGQRVTVAYDVGEDALAEQPGVVTHVSSEAAFTPTPIQTREERVDFVYAVEIAVPNPEGAIKIGMPGEVWFDRDEGA